MAASNLPEDIVLTLSHRNAIKTSRNAPSLTNGKKITFMKYLMDIFFIWHWSNSNCQVSYWMFLSIPVIYCTKDRSVPSSPCRNFILNCKMKFPSAQCYRLQSIAESNYTWRSIHIIKKLRNIHSIKSILLKVHSVRRRSPLLSDPRYTNWYRPLFRLLKRFDWD